MFNSSSIYSESWCRTVFANRNQAYGAYDLRKINERNTIMGLLFTTTMVLGATIFVYQKTHGSKPPASSISALEQNKDTMQIYQITLPETQPEQAASAGQTVVEERATNTENPAEIKVVKDDQLKEETKETKTVVSTENNTQLPTNPKNGTGTSTLPTATADQKENGNAGGGQGSGIIPAKTVAEIMPEFPGGERALLQYLKGNTKYPASALEEDKEGTVYVTFVVERDGQVSSVHVEKSIFRPLDNEAMRVVKEMPKWKPGMQNGQTVRVQFTVPIRFVVS